MLSQDRQLDISVDRHGNMWIVIDSCIYSLDPLVGQESWLSLRDNMSRLRKIQRAEQINSMALGGPFLDVQQSNDVATAVTGSGDCIDSPQPPRDNALFSFFDVDPEDIVASVTNKDEAVYLSTDDIPTPTESLAVSSTSSLSSTNLTLSDNFSIPTGVDSAGAKFIWYSRMRKWSDAAELSFEGFEFLAARMSEAQEVLISVAVAESKCMASFAQFERVGLGLWISNMARLRELLETIAKVDYSLDRDPRNCTLIYILIGRQVGLGMLWRQSAPRIATFLSSDFSQANVRNVAAKNAFAAQSKQDYRLSVIFFLLAGQYRDAIVVCLDKLHNLHLATLIIRFKLGQGDLSTEVVENILLSYVHAIPMLVRVLIRKICNDALDIMELYELESETVSSRDTTLCIPLAMASLRRLPLSSKRALDCVHMLCRHACFESALRLSELYPDDVHPALRTILKLQVMASSAI